MSQIEDYERVADAYEESMGLPFRDAVEQPSERGNPFWDDFLSRSPIVGFEATR